MKHRTLNQWTLVYCWSDICDAGPAMHQHWLKVCCLLGAACPVISIRSPKVDSMLAQRLRRWANIEPTLGERLLFASWSDLSPLSLISLPQWTLHCRISCHFVANILDSDFTKKATMITEHDILIGVREEQTAAAHPTPAQHHTC